MEKVIKTLTKVWKHHVPQSLPIGMTEFDHWSDEIIENYGFPQNDSTKFTLSTMVMHLDHEAAKVPYKTFAKRIKKSMANQIAGEVMHQCKKRQMERMEKEKAAENVEVPVSEV